MIRLFKRSNKRRVTALDGIWKFKIDPDKRGVIEEWFKKFPCDSMDIVVPSCWNNELGLYDYEGAAWYYTTFINTEKNVNLHFYGITGQSEVYVDGVHIGSHYGGFTGFNFTLKDLNEGFHTLIIYVDNTHDNINTIPLAKVDWFHYGGITRSVELTELGDIWIKDYRIDYKLSDDLKDAYLTFNVILEGLNEGEFSRNLSIYAGDEKLYSASVNVNGETNVKVSEILMKNVKLWNIYSPNLYTIRFEVEDDDIIDRIGFRKIYIENRKLYINNRQVRIKGVNRHEDHPDWGFALPLKIMKKDIDIIKNLGCNAIRGSHYPNAPIFLDYCDQEGILFWEEIPMWGFPEEALKNPVILDRGLMMHEEMVKRDYHHPSIIIWSMHNEVDTRTQAAYDITKAFAEKVRSLDNTRPLSYATMHPLDDICLSLVDIVSINKYFGWYEGNIEKWEEFLKLMKEKLNRENLQHMPIIISEFGAGAIYGDSTFEGPKWTENYQEKYLNYTLNLFHNDSDITGTYIWQYCDIRTAKELEMGRPRSFNNKGIVNEYRKPKLSYWTVKKIYEALK